MIDDHMGDFILSLPTLSRLNSHFSHKAHLYVASQHVPLAKLLWNPELVFPYAHKSKTRRTLSQLFNFIGLLCRLPFKRYQAVIFASTRITESTFAVLSLSPRRIALSSARRKQVYNQLIDISDLPDPHIAQRFSALLECIGEPAVAQPIHLDPSEQDNHNLETLLNTHGVESSDKVGVIHPTAGLAHRCWPKERFAAVADDMAEKGIKICFIGAPGEEDSCLEMIALMHHPENAFFIAQPLTILLALFKRATVLFSNESGPTHLAATTDIPIVTITGPTEMKHWKPFREENLKLLSRKDLCDHCGDPRFCKIDWPCIKKITVNEALNALKEYL